MHTTIAASSVKQQITVARLEEKSTRLVAIEAINGGDYAKAAIALADAKALQLLQRRLTALYDVQAHGA